MRKTKSKSLYSLPRIKCSGCGESSELGEYIVHPVACSQYVGFCHCGARAGSLSYDDKTNALVPVCHRHILVYRVGMLWEAEDEYAGLPFHRRSLFRRLAQLYILGDQRMYTLSGELSRPQRRDGRSSLSDLLHMLITW